MGYGGPTWDTAGTLDLGSGNTFNPADATENGPEFTFIESVGWWSYTAPETTILGIAPADSSDVRLRFYEGADYASKVQVTSSGFEDPTEFYPVVAGVTYHLMVGTAEFHTSPALYQVTVSVPAPLNVSPWFTDYQDNPDNYIIIHANSGSLDFPVGATDLMGDALQEQYHRFGKWTIQRELDSPAYGGNGCAWAHARWGDYDGIIWEGSCPPVFPGSVDGVAVHGPPHYGSDYGPTFGGDAEERVMGHALWVHRIYDRLEPFGSLGTPDPGAHGYPPDAVLEVEQPKPDFVSVEYTGDDEVPRPVTGSGAIPVGVDWLDTHLEDPPPVLVPSGFDPIDGIYKQWPKGSLVGLYTYTDGDPEWQTLIEGVDWDYFNFPVDGSGLYPSADFLFGSCAEHDNPDNGGGDRPGYTIAVRVKLRAPRYRWHYTAPSTIPPRRIRQRGDGLTGGARGIKTGARTRQAGNRTIGGIL